MFQSQEQYCMHGRSSIFSCSVGYFVEPTILKTTDPENKLMQEVTHLELTSCVLSILNY